MTTITNTQDHFYIAKNVTQSQMLLLVDMHLNMIVFKAWCSSGCQVIFIRWGNTIKIANLDHLYPNKISLFRFSLRRKNCLLRGLKSILATVVSTIKLLNSFFYLNFYKNLFKKITRITDRWLYFFLRNISKIKQKKKLNILVWYVSH